MRRMTRIICVVLLMCCAFGTLGAARTTDYRELQKSITSVTAESAIIMNADSFEVTWNQNDTDVQSIASLTKIMTAYVVLQDGVPLDKKVKITLPDVKRASVTYLRSGDVVTVETLLKLMVVGSDNAAARALARTSAKTAAAFVDRMNETAEMLDLEHTRYADPSGLDAGNRSTAFDIAKLLVSAERSAQDKLVGLFNTPVFQLKLGKRNLVVANTNRYMDEYTLASKTGYTSAAKYCLAVMFTAPNQQRYVLVILGAPSSTERWDIAKSFRTVMAEELDESYDVDECGVRPTTISEQGKDFIRRYERLTTKPYFDHKGYAVGYGMHYWQGQKVTKRWPFVEPHEVEDEFDVQLQKYASIVHDEVCAPLTQPMMDSLVSIAWNLGRVNTSITRKFESQRPIFTSDFTVTAKVKNRPYPKLVDRRLREFLMFTGDYDTAMDSKAVVRAAAKGGTILIMESK